MSCYFYPSFIVKEYDEGVKGAELAIVPTKRGAVPPCTRDVAVGQIHIDEGGYFKGAKGNLAFINASDGTDGGLPFSVYDSTTGGNIFEDSVRDPDITVMKIDDSPFDRMRFGTAPGGGLYLRYLRVVALDCDLHLEKASCRDRARKKLELKSAQMPVCSNYEGVSGRWVSAIAYPVEVSLFPLPNRKTIAGPVKCWPVD